MNNFTFLECLYHSDEANPIWHLPVLGPDIHVKRTIMYMAGLGLGCERLPQPHCLEGGHGRKELESAKRTQDSV